MNVKSAALLLGIKRITLNRYILQGRIKAYRVNQKEWAISRAELKRFAAVPRPIGRPTNREESK